MVTRNTKSHRESGKPPLHLYEYTLIPLCGLKKSLYGLKQPPRMWYKKLDTYIWGVGFTSNKVDHCVYFKLISYHVIVLVLYVDDMLLIGNEK